MEMFAFLKWAKKMTVSYAPMVSRWMALKIYANNILDAFVNDYGRDKDITGSFIALYDVHTTCAPTGKFSEAHTTIDPAVRLYWAHANKFTHAIDERLEKFAASGINPFLLSIGLDGFACKADLIMAWLRRSPPFTLVIRETGLIHGIDAAQFPQYSSGLVTETA
jgi:hypothetical protein